MRQQQDGLPKVTPEGSESIPNWKTTGTSFSDVLIIFITLGHHGTADRLLMLICLLEEQLEAKDDKRVSSQHKDPLQERDVDPP